MARDTRSFSPATCLSCRQPFSAQLGLVCTLDTAPPEPGSAWRRLRERLRRTGAPHPAADAPSR
jgi:hypothetical protein